jgi:site-specific DNA-methyltransferase (adenine-specific)
MKTIPDNSIDMVLTDPPYGTTACKWDSVIPFEPMWKELKRITKDNGAICLFGQNPFTANLIMSNTKMYRYEIIWEKDQAKNFLFMKKQIGKAHENISVFYSKQPTYNPQMRKGFKPASTGGLANIKTMDVKLKKKGNRQGAKDRYPISVIKYTSLKKAVHPTQKPVELLEFLVKTYTNENETVLDFTMGSGSTGVAAKNLNRNFIGIEKDDKYYNIAKERIYG